MTRTLTIAALALSLSACATGPGYGGPRLRPAANPSAVITSELAFARLAREKGQWTAFRQTSTGDAVLFVPQRVNAHTWLKGRTDPATSVSWHPDAVWSSCDGSYAVTQGHWQSGNASGGFVTVWQRQGDERSRRTEYKWVLDMSVTTEHRAGPDETITAKVATCTPPALMSPPLAVADGGDTATAYARDNSLRWTSSVRVDKSRRIVVESWNGSTFDRVLELDGRDID
jgi:hypothetical protein